MGCSSKSTNQKVSENEMASEARKPSQASACYKVTVNTPGVGSVAYAGSDLRTLSCITIDQQILDSNGEQYCSKYSYGGSANEISMQLLEKKADHVTLRSCGFSMGRLYKIVWWTKKSASQMLFEVTEGADLSRDQRVRIEPL